ncbi:cleavage stimulation factor subunit 77-like isoform X2 [Euphorbia lathyris]|uniref:cleavage stimulation factor subunit 77-like isoform X2 n=1 Tax=Euphorbia lathyris TaxID=212925 RepID=UPI0033132FA1
MYLYHYPDIWYDYATWHAKSGAIDAAIKVFQRALKALPGLGTPPDSEMLKFAYAELEESHGAIHPAKKIYESLLGDGVDATALAHIQVMQSLAKSIVWDGEGATSLIEGNLSIGSIYAGGDPVQLTGPEL